MLLVVMFLHCVKSVRIRSYSDSYFPVFGLNIDQNNFKYRHFLRSVSVDFGEEFTHKVNGCNFEMLSFTF